MSLVMAHFTVPSSVSSISVGGATYAVSGGGITIPEASITPDVLTTLARMGASSYVVPPATVLPSYVTRRSVAPAGLGCAGTGLLIPLYQYPANVYSNVAINGLLDVLKANRAVPTMVVVNQSNGPGPLDGNVTALINRLHGAGASVLAYVHTSNAARAFGDVTYDIETWLTEYPKLDGLFVDEMDNSGTAASVQYYADLTGYAHARGLYPVVANAGTSVPQPYFDRPCADVLVVYEGAGYPAESFIKGDYAGGYADYDAANRGGIVYAASSLDTTQVAMMKKYLGWLYVTDAPSNNAFGALPTYLSGLCAALAR